MSGKFINYWQEIGSASIYREHNHGINQRNGLNYIYPHN